MYSPRRDRYSIGISCAPMNVGTMSMACSSSSVRMARSCRSSGFDFEAVTALGLADRGAAGEHLVEPHAGRRDQLLLGRRARGRHGLHDSAAVGRDRGVRFAAPDGAAARRARSPAYTTCVCGSTKPGPRVQPRASMRVAPFRTVHAYRRAPVAAPTYVMRPS